MFKLKVNCFRLPIANWNITLQKPNCVAVFQSQSLSQTFLKTVVEVKYISQGQFCLQIYKPRRVA